VCWIAEDAISAFAATSVGRAVLGAAGSESACSTSWWSGEPIDAFSVEFRGAEAVRKIEQSTMRGGAQVYIFKSWNPPRTAASWVTRYTKIPKPRQWQHSSDYFSFFCWVGPSPS
jgi:hypothetical protein